jgi:hypothetical protein
VSVLSAFAAVPPRRDNLRCGLPVAANRSSFVAEKAPFAKAMGGNLRVDYERRLVRKRGFEPPLDFSN